MDFYVIPPIAHLELMKKGNRIFGLAQLYIEHEHYRNFLKQCKKEGYFITMDNGAGDHALVTEDILIEVVRDLMPNEVIAPDILFDKHQTIKNLISFVKRIQKEGLDEVEIFGCPQGATKEDWLECYEYMLNHESIKTIGLSKIAVPFAFKGAKDDQLIMESRHECYDYLVKNNLLKKPIHCLGAGSPLEFSYYRDNPLMRSTDSCFSIWSAMCGISWKEGNFSRIKTPHDYFDRIITDTEMTLVNDNINFLEKSF